MFDPPPRHIDVAWRVGDQVERLLDDISDIWAAAVVCATCEPGLYDVRYIDNGSIEQGVESSEMRSRRTHVHLPDDVWERASAFSGNHGTLCAVEGLARGPRLAAVGQADVIWCAAYHYRFDRCSDVCCYERLNGLAGILSARRAVETCVAAEETISAPSPTGKRRSCKQTWKQKYMERFHCETARFARMEKERLLLL